MANEEGSQISCGEMQNCHGSCDEHLIIKIGSGILEYDYMSWEEQEPPRLFLNPRYQISSIKNGRVADFFPTGRNLNFIRPLNDIESDD